MKALSLSFAVFLSLSYPVHALETPTKARLAEIEKRGGEVMPFNLDKTTHIFIKTENGGVQQVIVKDKADYEQINLIRRHLLKIFQDLVVVKS